MLATWPTLCLRSKAVSRQGFANSVPAILAVLGALSNRDIASERGIAILERLGHAPFYCECADFAVGAQGALRRPRLGSCSDALSR